MYALLQQTNDTTRDFLSSYGTWGIIAWLAFRDIVPWLKETFSASYKARLAREEHEMQLRADREEREAQIRADREERLTKVLSQFGEQLQTFGLAMTVVTERLTQIERDQDAVRRTVEILADRKSRSEEK